VVKAAHRQGVAIFISWRLDDKSPERKQGTVCTASLTLRASITLATCHKILLHVVIRTFYDGIATAMI
jgi:hypothetical protein